MACALALACAALAGTACSPGDAGRASDSVSMTWTVAPDPATVGPARLTLILEDRRGPVTGARLQVEADMTHPGMRPVVAEAVERAPGRYQADLDFAMAGSWFILVTGDVPADGAFSRRIDLAHVRAR